MTDPLELMTVDEVAAALRVARSTLYGWRSPGAEHGPPSFTVGNRVVYLRSEVEAYLRRQITAADADRKAS